MMICHRLRNKGWCRTGCRFGGPVLCHKHFCPRRVCLRGDSCRFAHHDEASMPRSRSRTPQSSPPPPPPAGAGSSDEPPPFPPPPPPAGAGNSDGPHPFPPPPPPAGAGSSSNRALARPLKADLALFNIAKWEQSSIAQVKGLYKAKALELHPDKASLAPADQDAATSKMQALNNAYERLLLFSETNNTELMGFNS